MFDQDAFLLAALVDEGLVTPEIRDDALREAAAKHIQPIDYLVESGHVTGRDVALVRASLCERPFVDLAMFQIDLRHAARLPRSTAEQCVAFPLFCTDDLITVGMEDPLDLRAVDKIRSLLKTEIEPVLCEKEALLGLITRAYALVGAAIDAADPFATAELTTGEEPMVAAINQIIAQAIDEAASDIHIGADERELHIRYRIDGTLQQRPGPPKSAHAGLIQRLKVMANLDLTQTRRPQDGKFRFSHRSRRVDVRLSILPTICGENAVLRLLASSAMIQSFDKLGFPPRELEEFQRLIHQPHGMVLVTGPTGSGKTTTLYTALNELNSPDVNIVTVEDPVEIRIPLIRQVQVNAEIGLTFANALRAILRQDPDIVLVGEIRDEETARIATQAALTGHIVFSTLHTNDAAGAIARLRDFGCPPYAINSALLCVLAQRLVRRICTECARPARCDPALASRFGLKDGEQNLMKGTGCPRCGSTGYKGRVAVYELLRVTRAVQELIERGASTADIRARAIADGMKLMWQNGLHKALAGETTLEEIVRVVATELDDSTRHESSESPLRMSA